ncbi:uncharacterized protein LOC106135151 [Amyelois transitella]|uniref:uncharacterized protein LOC106135151 n=1 Tax=Amyelois transitella TaxID=680683 RepID=UPI00298FCE60|nr:uncharacterized protein LOC106135151 [Amyelois transitella]
MYSAKKMEYRAFCAGSIITRQRVLSSAHCFYSNRKRLRHQLNEVQIVAGLLLTVQRYPSNVTDTEQQWRIPTRVFTQKFYRFPAFSLAVIEINLPWKFNHIVNKIPYAKSTLDYDGVCNVAVVKITKSWAYKKYLFTEQHRIVPREKCERKLLRTCRLYICTMAEIAQAESETAGAGLVCFETGTAEEDPQGGLLVGVTVLINIGLPSLHHRIAMFDKWVADGAYRVFNLPFILLFTCLCMVL